MALVWVTGISGAGKSTVCEVLRAAGRVAVDADNDGYCSWFDRGTGDLVSDPPHPVPAGWLDRYGWGISPRAVARLAEASDGRVTFLCGSVENEAAVRSLFDLIVCLVIDEKTLRHRLATRTTNTFGRHPEELAAALMWNPRMRLTYEQLGAVIVDASRQPPQEIAELIIRAASEISGTATSRSSQLDCGIAAHPTTGH